jgi:hypothetical protein
MLVIAVDVALQQGDQMARRRHGVPRRRTLSGFDLPCGVIGVPTASRMPASGTSAPEFQRIPKRI